MKTFHIHIKGCVQGVGFRPFVYRLAIHYYLTGWVCNTSEGVHIEVTGLEENCLKFCRECISEAPQLANIVSHTINEKQFHDFDDFKIVESTSDREIDLAIMPDLAICPDCLEELLDNSDRRNGYSFITCTNCGPRYSIIRSLPYDRPFTSMDPFKMCPACQLEYDDPLDRRYYSQTNSCKECGISLHLFDRSGTICTDQNEIMAECSKLLSDNLIIAVKGVGGYLLLCSAGNSQVIRELRRRKQRPHKPFAVLISTTDLQESRISTEAYNELEGPESPIVVVPYNQVSNLNINMDHVAPGLDQVGIMYPYAPLLFQLSDGFMDPLIATSANQSGMPILYQDSQDEYDELFKYADAILTHNRTIIMPQDDSVIKFSAATNTGIVLRRSRGMAPNYFHRRNTLPDQVLALGAQLKSTFTLTRRSNIYISQYLGNSETYENQAHFRNILKRFKAEVGAKPIKVIADKHPDYFSNHLGKELSGDQPLVEVQHHEAHMLAVLGENDLLNSDFPILGVIWDGTGYGNDKQIWGGEFFQYHKGDISRINHFNYFPILSGDKMAIEPRLSALSLLKENYDILKDRFSDKEWDYFKKAKENPAIYTSSMGRIFDAISCLLGLIDKSTYEGQAGMMLEMKAAQWYFEKGWDRVDPLGYRIDSRDIKVDKTLSDIILGMDNGDSVDYLAAQFHETLIRIILDIAEKFKYYHMVFSGGVFQNGVLVDLLKLRSEKRHQLYFHKSLSPNDENISFGQLVHYLESLNGK